LFKNELNPFNDVKIKRIVRGSGQCVEYISYRKGTNFFVLEMMPKYKNKMEFLNTLSHEMVHLWQQTIKKILVIIINFFLVFEINLKD